MVSAGVWALCCLILIFMIVHLLGQSMAWIKSKSWCFGARAGALEHELVLCAIMRKLKASEKDIQNIVSDMAASADLSSGIVCSFCFYDCLLFRLKPVTRTGALEHELVLCAIMSKLKLSEKYIQNIVYDMAAQADPSKAK